MKITKKLIILLVMIIGILALSKPNVYAKDLPTKGEGHGKILDTESLERDKKYTIGYWRHYVDMNHLLCAQHKYHMNPSKDIKYKFIKKIKIENSVAIPYDSDNKEHKKNSIDTSEDKYAEDYNRILATGIAELKNNPEEQQAFVWGYLNTWITNVGKDFAGIPKDFAGKAMASNSGELVEDITEDVEDVLNSQVELKNITNNNKVSIKNLSFNNKNYKQIGPFQVQGISKGEGTINKYEICNEDNKKIKGALLVRNVENTWKEVDNNSIKIKNKGNFYILVPVDSTAKKIKLQLETEKITTTKVNATIYFFQSEKKDWQNLIYVDGDDNNKKTPVTLTVEYDVPANGKIKIYKKVLINGQPTDIPIEGAGFVVYRYAKNSKGSWVKDGADYYRPATDEEKKNSEVQKYRREYVKKGNGCFTYDGNIGYKNIIDLETGQHQDDYIFYTNGLGEVPLDYLVEDTYYAQECVLPQEYINNLGGELISYGECYTGNLKIDGQDKWRWDNILLGEVSANHEKKITMYNIPKNANLLKLLKVNKDNPNVKIAGVKFRLRHKKFGWIQKTDNGWQFTSDENSATWIATDSNGEINIPNAPIGNWEWREDLNSRPYGYDPEDPSSGEFVVTEDKENNVCEIKVTNKQKWVRLSGFVWVDKVGVKSGDGNDRNDLFKANQNGQPATPPDENDLLFDGITVKLMDKTTGQPARDKNGKELVTTTSKLDRYTDYGHNGHGEYLFEDVLIEKLGDYYIQFTYDGLNYTNIVPHIDQSNGSKAAESKSSRDSLNNKYATIEKDVAYGSGGTIPLEYDVEEATDTKAQTSTYIGYRESNYTIKEDESWIKQNVQLGDKPYSIEATTDEAKYSIKEDFTYGDLEVKYINLGLKDRDRPDIGLGKDIQNVNVSVNGYNHIYDYAQRYNGVAYDGEGFNVGVSFKEVFDGTYTRALYKADYEYDNPEDRGKELEVYITYALDMEQSNINLTAQINSITDYFDKRYSLERIGTSLNDDKSVGGIIAERKDRSTNRSNYRQRYNSRL